MDGLPTASPARAPTSEARVSADRASGPEPEAAAARDVR